MYSVCACALGMLCMDHVRYTAISTVRLLLHQDIDTRSYYMVAAVGCQLEVAPQSYQVQLEDGSYRRNRRDILRLPDSDLDSSNSEIGEQNHPNDLEPTNARRSNCYCHPPERLDPSWVNSARK